MTKKTKSMKFLSILLALIMAFGVVPLSASALTEGVLMYNVSNGEAKIIGCKEEAIGDVVIPETLGECPVTEISLYSFAGCEGITSVSMPDSVRKIGQAAFSDCTALTKITIGSGVTEILNNAFFGCTSLAEVKVSADNKVYVSDENGVLYNKDKTELLVYPAANSAKIYTVAENVEAIADNTFAGSKNVVTVVMGDNIKTIGNNAFLGSRSLETVFIGKGVKTIGADVFEGCNKLTGINVNTANEAYCSDENGVLYNKAKTQIMKYPTGSNKSEFKIVEGIEKINILAFANCISLEKIIISKTVKNIDASAFYGCTSIAEVNYEGSEAEWKEINIGANNENLTGAKITFAGGVEHEHSYSFSTEKKATCTEKGVVVYSCECGNSYKEEVPATGHNFANNICSACKTKEFEFTTDGTNAKITKYNSDASALVIPATVEGYNVNAIGDNAFENCTQITEITIPESVTDIGSCAFYKTGYYNNSANWENGVLYIDNFLIEVKETVAKDYVVKEGTTVIADYAFASRDKLEKITFPESLAVIGDSAFSGCTGLKDVVCGVTEDDWKKVVIGNVNENLTSANFVFKEIPHEHSYEVEEKKATCTEDGYKTSKCECGDTITETYLATGHNFVNNLCTGCFEREFEYSAVGGKVTVEGCHESLEGKIVIPETIGGYEVTAIGENAFKGNAKITEVVIHKGVSSIGTGAFALCAKLEKITIDEENADYVSEDGILYNKDKTVLLQALLIKKTATIEITETVKTVAKDAFAGWDSLEKITFSKNIEEICEGAFDGCTAIKDVYFGGTQTEWNKVELNGSFTSATIHFGDLSDVQQASELIKILQLINATATTEGVNIIITANEGADMMSVVADTTEETIKVSINTESVPVNVTSSGNYVITFVDWHKAGNKAKTTITIGDATFDVEFIFPVENNGHNYSVVTEIAPSCVDNGCTRYACSICGDFYDTDVTPAMGHKYGLWVIEKDETCTEYGEKVRECTVCTIETEGHFETGKVNPKGHDYIETVVEATCTDGGYTHFRCTRCEDEYTGAETQAKGHTYGAWVVTEATCTVDGKKTRECTVCGNVETEDISATGHNYNVTVTEPTETSGGYTTYTCSACGHTYDDNFVDPIKKVLSVSIENFAINRDEQYTIVPDIKKTQNGDFEHTVTYIVADESIATVDENGVVTGLNRGTTQITCIVTDEFGNKVTSVCSVEVKFTILQWITWIFVDIIFGFIKNLISQ